VTIAPIMGKNNRMCSSQIDGHRDCTSTPHNATTWTAALATSPEAARKIEIHHTIGGDSTERARRDVFG
jgi:hypothetical protein